jgi:hypothetical protein
MTKTSQQIWETFCGELIVEPTDDMKEALATALREVVNLSNDWVELDSWDVRNVVYVSDILNLADEVEAL